MGLPDTDPNIHVSLADLVGMRHLAGGFDYLPEQPLGSVLAGRFASRLRGRGLEFEELRHYQVGDDIRAMDWRVTRRTRQPHVRVYREEKEQSTLLLVDQRQSMFFGSRVRMKSVAAVHMAALTAWRVLGSGDRVGGIVFDDRTAVEFRPKRTQRNVMRILREAVRYNRALSAGAEIPDGEEALNRHLRRALHLAGHDHLVVLISDMRGWNDDTLEYLKRLSMHNSLVVAIVFDPLEAQLPGTGRLLVSDGELQIGVNAADTALGQAFREGFDRTAISLRRRLEAFRIPVILLNTLDPVVDQLRKSFRAGAGRGRPK